jgi:hypothetical protein
MSFGPSDYAGRLTQAEIDHINALTRPEDIAAYLHDQEVAAGLRVEDPMNPDIRHEVERVAQPFNTSITVNGKSYTFSGENQADVDRQQVEFFRSTFQSSEPAKLATTNETAVRDSQGRFVSEKQQPNANVSVMDPIVNNLVAKALAEVGISVEDLKEAVAEKQTGRAYEQSWADAVEVFKRTSGADWPGDSTGELRERLTNQMQKIYGDQDPPNKVEALTRAWQQMHAEGDQYFALRDAKTPEEIKTILGTRAREEARIRRGNSY